jgi:hypothetical protein
MQKILFELRSYGQCGQHGEQQQQPVKPIARLSLCLSSYEFGVMSNLEGVR